jgi:hypothetical protein
MTEYLHYAASVLPVIALALAIHIVLHETGHAVAARAVAFRVTGVQWSLALPGVVVTDDLPDGQPGPRLRWTVVHLAAPLVNLAVAGIAAHLAGVSLLAAFVHMYTPGAGLLIALGGVGLVTVAVSLVPVPFTDSGKTVLALATGRAGPHLHTARSVLWATTAALVLAGVAIAAARV